MTKLTESDDLPSALLEEIQLYNVALKQEDGEQLSEDDISALYQVHHCVCTISISYLHFVPGRCAPPPHIPAYQGADQGAPTKKVFEVQDHEDGDNRGRP